MNTIRTVREQLKTIVSTAGIFPEDAIIVERKADIFERVRKHLALAKNKMCLVIGVGSGTNLTPDSRNLYFECEFTIGVWCHTIYDGNDDEEQKWQELLKLIHHHGDEHCDQRWQVLSFEDIEIEAQPGSTKGLLVRSTRLRKRVALV